MCILVVEDDPTLGALLKKQLSKLGYLTDLVTSAAEALSKFKIKSYDLILMDIALPEGNGLELTEQIRQVNPRGKDVKIVGVTAGHASKSECLRAGMNDYYEKPFLTDDVKTVMDKFNPGTCESC
jgi:two-component system sensor histidine kinase/response regulator